MVWDSRHLNEAEISRRLANAQREAHKTSFPAELLVGDRQAAVLIPFLRIEQAWHLLFTPELGFARAQRAGRLSRWATDPDDPDLETNPCAKRTKRLGSCLPIRILGRLYDF